MKILLAIDGSAHSRFAEQVVRAFPWSEPPEVLAVSVCPVPDLHHIGRDVSGPVNAMVDDCRNQGRELVDECGLRMEGIARRVETRLLDGHPGKELISTAESEHVDLVVLGARGHSGVHRMLLGSVSEKIAKYAPCSVLVAHEGEGEPKPGLQKILLATDGSPLSRAAAEQFSRLPLGPDREVTVLHIIEEMGAYGTDVALQASEEWQHDVEQRRAAAEEVGSLLKPSGARIHVETRQSSKAADAILAAAEEFHSDLIVLGSTGKSGWERLLLGSVSSRVIHQAPCSVWLHRLRPSST